MTHQNPLRQALDEAMAPLQPGQERGQLSEAVGRPIAEKFLPVLRALPDQKLFEVLSEAFAMKFGPNEGPRQVQQALADLPGGPSRENLIKLLLFQLVQRPEAGI